MLDSLFSQNFRYLIISNFFLFLGFLSYQLLPLHIKALGGSEQHIGWVMGLPNLVSVGLTPVFGILVDRLGRKPFVILGQCFVALPSLGFLLGDDSFLLFAGLRVLQNVGVAMALTAASTLVADSAPAGRLAQALGIYGLSGLSTHAVAPAIGEIVLSMGGFVTLFAVTTVYGAVGLSIASRISEPTAGAIRKEESSPLWKVFTAPGFGPILLLGLVMGATLGSVLTYAPTYIRSRGIQWISPFYIAYTLTAIFVRVFLGRMSDRLGHRRVIVPGVLGMIAGVSLLSQADAQWMFGLAGLLNGASHGLLYPAMNALALGRAGQANYGKAQSLFASAFGAGMTLGVFLNGFVAEELGYPAMYLWTAGWIAIGLVLFRAWERRIFLSETPKIGNGQ